MSAPPRLLEKSEALPKSLVRALRGAPASPGHEELRALAGSLSSTLGTAITAPAVPHAVSSVVVGAIKAKSQLVLAAWVMGGVVMGVGLSGAVAGITAAFDNPTPPRSVAAVTVSPAAPQRAEPERASTLPSPTDSARTAAVEPSTAPRASSRPHAPGIEPSTSTEPDETELSLLRQAQQAAASDPSRALSLTALHLARFPSGVLAQERDVIAIDALLRLGRSSEARARARAFEQSYPGSAHAQRLHELLPRSGL
ncbi:MAG TPA: hypothetical protein VEQ59_21665 [Polyangiaceae bacterium]|nr:hypothetical protein [Polyangiaceae bacterium]